MLTYVAVSLIGFLLFALWARNYLRNHCLECKKRTDWGKYDTCLECKAGNEARVLRHRKKVTENMCAAMNEAYGRVVADEKEFGFSDWDILDRPCTVCVPGSTKSHREIFRELGLAGDPRACQRYWFTTHLPLSKKSHRERESKKFWKRWLYVRPTAAEEAAVGRIGWLLKNTLLGGREDLALLREYRTYREDPDHWMNMTTKALLERRLRHAKSMLGIGRDE